MTCDTDTSAASSGSDHELSERLKAASGAEIGIGRDYVKTKDAIFLLQDPTLKIEGSSRIDRRVLKLDETVKEADGSRDTYILKDENVEEAKRQIEALHSKGWDAIVLIMQRHYRREEQEKSTEDVNLRISRDEDKRRGNLSRDALFQHKGACTAIQSNEWLRGMYHNQNAFFGSTLVRVIQSLEWIRTYSGSTSDTVLLPELDEQRIWVDEDIPERDNLYQGRDYVLQQLDQASIDTSRYKPFLPEEPLEPTTTDAGFARHAAYGMKWYQEKPDIFRSRQYTAMQKMLEKLASFGDRRRSEGKASGRATVVGQVVTSAMWIAELLGALESDRWNVVEYGESHILVFDRQDTRSDGGTEPSED